MSKGLSRRHFLMSTAAGAATLAVGAKAKGAPSLNERIQFGVIGSGGKGWSGMMAAAEHGAIVAICDVDINNRTKASLEFPDAATFEDYRDMIAAMRGKVDAVIISTPDHHHATASALSMKAGMHVYCEKPLTRTLYEARRLAELAKRHRVMTQMGNQSTSMDSLRKAAALIKAGKFGAVKEIHCWTDRAGGWWPQGIGRPKSDIAPKTLDWNLWLGPSPNRDYAKGYHPFAWRGWWDFGTGALGDIGCHCINLPFMALDLRDPLAVQAETSGHNGDSFPAWSIVHYEFGPRKGRPALKLHWYDGGKRPDQRLAPQFEFGGNGLLVVCEGDTFYAANEYGGDPKLASGAPMPEIDFERIEGGHMADFARSIQTGKPASSNIPGYSGPLTETVLMGNLAVWAGGKRVEWDGPRLRARNTNEFDKLIRPEFRPGWSL